MDQNRTQLLKKYPSAKQFITNFRVENNMLKDLISYANDQGVIFDSRSYEFCQKDIRNQVKAYIGRGLYDNDAFYPVLLSKDKTFLKAIEEFKR